MVSTNRSVTDTSLVNAAGPDVSHGITPPSFASFLDLEQLKPRCHLQGLIFKGVVVQELIV